MPWLCRATRSMGAPRSRDKPLALQQLRLRKLFPNARCRIQRSELTWEADLTPTPLSETYRVRLTYKLDRAPRVVVATDLERMEDCPLPHTYEDDLLCLYLPRRGEWKRDAFLADTIVPWASEWLANYETWLFTGKWLGGGTHEERWDRPTPEPSGATQRSSRDAHARVVPPGV